MIIVAAAWTGCSTGPSSPIGTPRPPAEVFGHRFAVLADVDGDGRQDTVREVYWSEALGREAAKFLADMPYDSLVWHVGRLKPKVILRCGSAPADTLRTGDGFGLALLVNEGDLDGDGADELGYVPDNADWSNLCTYHVIGLRKGAWREHFAFPIWEWQLNEVPGNMREYGLVGQVGRRVDGSDGAFIPTDLVLPVRPGMARVVGNTGDANLDTMDVYFTDGDSVRFHYEELGPP